MGRPIAAAGFGAKTGREFLGFHERLHPIFGSHVDKYSKTNPNGALLGDRSHRIQSIFVLVGSGARNTYDWNKNPPSWAFCRAYIY